MFDIYVSDLNINFFDLEIYLKKWDLVFVMYLVPNGQL